MASDKKSVQNKAESYLNGLVDNSHVVGIQYIVVNPDGVVFEYAGGMSDIKNKTPMTIQTPMMAYSMSKTITAAAVLKLVEQGKLNLDDNVITYYPHPYGDDVTIRHLVSQTSGIPNPIPLKWAHLAEEHDTFDEDSVLVAEMTKNSKLKFKPGSKYLYANIPYWILGKVIEKASGQSFQSYVVDNIISPLNPNENSLGFEIQDPQKHAKGYLAKYSFMNLIKGFLMNSKLFGEYEGSWLHFKNHYVNGAAFGGLVGSAAGFVPFLQDMLMENPTLFSKGTRTLFFTQQKDNSGQPVQMTLGWHVGESDGVTYYFKEGGGAGYHCEMRVYPSLEIATIVMVNRTMFKTKKFLNSVDSMFHPEAIN